MSKAFGEPLNSDAYESCLEDVVCPMPEAANLLIEAFWSEDPTDTWRPHIQAVNAELEAGKPLIMISALHGSGKTNQLLSTLINERPDGQVGVQSAHPKELTFDLSKFDGESIILIDENAPQDEEEATNTAAGIAQVLADGRQVVLATTGPSVESRKKHSELITAALQKHGIEPTILDDVTDVHVTIARATVLLRQLGFSQDAISLFEEIPALRSPRLFSHLTNGVSYIQLHYAGEQVKASDLQSLFTGLAHFERIATFKENPLYFAAYDIISSAYQNYKPRAHALFMTSFVTTADSIQLYQALGEPLPTEADFPNPGWFAYAYSKN